MNNLSEAFVAFDTSKLRNAVAIADAGRAGEIRFLGEITAVARELAGFIWAISREITAARAVAQ
jgi:hypothetical protein